MSKLQTAINTWFSNRIDCVDLEIELYTFVSDEIKAQLFVRHVHKKLEHYGSPSLGSELFGGRYQLNEIEEDAGNVFGSPFAGYKVYVNNGLGLSVSFAKELEQLANVTAFDYSDTDELAMITNMDIIDAFDIRNKYAYLVVEAGEDTYYCYKDGLCELYPDWSRYIEVTKDYLDEDRVTAILENIDKEIAELEAQDYLLDAYYDFCDEQVDTETSNLEVWTNEDLYRKLGLVFADYSDDLVLLGEEKLYVSISKSSTANFKKLIEEDAISILQDMLD